MISDIIEIYVGETNTALDGEVLKAVRNVGINVNKNELVKALQLAEKLVYCRECKRLKDCRGDSWQTSVINMGYIGWCNRTSRLGDVDYVKEYDFCSYGEREE